MFALSFLLLSFYVYSFCHVKQCFVLYCLLIILNKEIKYIYVHILLGQQYKVIPDKFIKKNTLCIYFKRFGEAISRYCCYKMFIKIKIENFSSVIVLDSMSLFFVSKSRLIITVIIIPYYIYKNDAYANSE